jgi:flagellar biosynthesis protein FlhA
VRVVRQRSIIHHASRTSDAMTIATAAPGPDGRQSNHDIGFAIAIVMVLTLLFLPLPVMLIDAGIAFSIAISLLILMVALWIQKPLEFSAFPTILLIATMVRLSLNVATTRQILSNGADGYEAAGHVIAGFANFVMGGDFLIGTIVFIILVTVNFLVITKGATRIAEVGARFTLDAIPGKQMAVDADLSAGLIDDKEAQRRRRELEEESAFFGSMDGASKFVRGDAIAGLIITSVNVVGGVMFGMFRHDMSFAKAVDIFTKLSVGDGIVTQIPALIVSLAAGLLVSKGGTRGSADKAIFGQLGNYPRALTMSAVVLFVLGLAPGLPLVPFALLGGTMGFIAYSIPLQRERQLAEDAKVKAAEGGQQQATTDSIKSSLTSFEIEICLGKQVYSALLSAHGELGHRVAMMRRKFAKQYGLVVPEIRLTDDITAPAKSYLIKVHGTVAGSGVLRIGDMLVVVGEGPRPDVPSDETREPAFGMKALWIPQSLADSVKREGFVAIDNMSVLLTHVGEVVRNNLAQLLSYRDMRLLLERLDPVYRKLIEEVVPTHISNSGLQAVLKLLLAERVSIHTCPFGSGDFMTLVRAGTGGRRRCRRPAAAWSWARS